MIHFEDQILKLTEDDINSINVITDPLLVMNSKEKMNGVYFLYDGFTLTKIGYSKNAKARISNVTSSCPRKLEFLGFLEVTERDGLNVAEHIEHLIHYMKEDLRYNGEWFLTRPDKSIFKNCVEMLKSLSFPLTQNLIKNQINVEDGYDKVLDIISNGDDDETDTDKIYKISIFLDSFYKTKLSRRMLNRQAGTPINSEKYFEVNKSQSLEGIWRHRKIKILSNSHIDLEYAAHVIFSDQRLNLRMSNLLFRLVLMRGKLKEGVFLHKIIQDWDLNYSDYLCSCERLYRLGYINLDSNSQDGYLNIDFDDEFADFLNSNQGEI